MSCRTRAVPGYVAHVPFAGSRHNSILITSARHPRNTVSHAYAAPPPTSSDDSTPEDWASLFEKLKKQKWDDAPKPWRDFWATKVAAAVVEVDVNTESINAKEVEGIGLNSPKDKQEAMERFKLNAVIYKQNYLVIFWATSTLFAALADEYLLAISLLCTVVAMVTKSDTLLGELQLATDNKLTWNKTRVAGLDRAMVHLATKVAAGVCFIGAPLITGEWVEFTLGFVERFIFLGLLPCLAHSMLRPIDLKSTLSDLWNDAKGVQTKEEAAALAKKGVKGIKSWWNNRRPAEPTPVVMSVKGDPDAAYRAAGFAGQQAQQAAREQDRQRRKAQDDEGVVDTEGWSVDKSKGELPPGK